MVNYCMDFKCMAGFNDSRILKNSGVYLYDEDRPADRSGGS